MAAIPDKVISATIFSTESDVELVIPGESDPGRKLDITLQCVMTTKPSLNRGTLTVLNLSDRSMDALAGVISSRIDYPPELTIGSGSAAKTVQTRELFPDGFQITETIRRGDAYVTVDAGEDSFVGRVFEGTAKPIRHEWDASGTWVTSMDITDGLSTQLSGVAAVEFPPNARLFDVVQHIIRSMALEPGNFTPAQLNRATSIDPDDLVTRGAYFPRGFTTAGDAVRLLDEMLGIQGAEWWVDRGKFYVVKAGQAVDAPPVPIEPDDGIRMQPRPRADGSVALSIDFRRDIRVGHRVNLKTDRLAGVYRVEQVAHEINNRLGGWSTAAILRTIETVPGVF